jgi:hypothetical protein
VPLNLQDRYHSERTAYGVGRLLGRKIKTGRYRVCLVKFQDVPQLYLAAKMGGMLSAHTVETWHSLCRSSASSLVCGVNVDYKAPSGQ